uniref:Uncharacterized protein n=1 Tax=Arundo donax TaxID=35708 RepID=A0A0A9CAU2_ARUDO
MQMFSDSNASPNIQ